MYVGRPYIVDVFECGELAQLVNREVFGREIRLPAERWHAGKSGRARFDAIAGQIDAAKDDSAVRTESPADGDGVLLISRARPRHIGTYCVINGERWVLHCTSAAGQAILTRIRELHLQDLMVEGFYRWK